MERVRNANGTRSERKWNAFGTQMERARNTNGTRSERKWNANAVLGYFFSKFRSQNFNYKKCDQNAGNRISEVLDFKIFRGGNPRTPLLMRGFGFMHQSANTLDPSLSDSIKVCKLH